MIDHTNEKLNRDGFTQIHTLFVK